VEEKKEKDMLKQKLRLAIVQKERAAIEE